MAIGAYSIMAIGAYFINGYWWLLMAILLMVINGYCIISYC